jgi:hypothetical protein
MSSTHQSRGTGDIQWLELMFEDECSLIAVEDDRVYVKDQSTFDGSTIVFEDIESMHRPTTCPTIRTRYCRHKLHVGVTDTCTDLTEFDAKRAPPNPHSHKGRT